jgi:KaiC/GvpD/RAD55 family RecA-like ATPase
MLSLILNMRFGIPEIDKAVKMSKPVSLLVKGSPGSGKHPLVQKFISTLDENEVGVYLTTDSTPQAVLEKLKEFNPKLDDKKIVFIDCYSWTLGQKEGDDYFVPGPFALNELGVVLGKVVKNISKKGMCIKFVLDSLSTLLLYADQQKLYKFLQIVSAKLKAANFYALYVVEEGMHNSETITTLEHLTDSTVSFMTDNFGKRRLMFTRWIETGWIEFPRI